MFGRMLNRLAVISSILICSLLVGAPTTICAALLPGSFYADGPRNKPAIALTFDDGPGEFTLRVLEILDRYKIKATFFMNGDQVEIRPQIAKEVLKRGHEIGDHTYSHVNFYVYGKVHSPDKTKDKIKEEMKRSREVLQKTLGIAPRICRMPHGFHKPWMKGIAKDFGTALVNWTYGEDWKNIPEGEMAEDYIRALKPGAILLFHDGGKNRSKTLNILPKVIEKARAKNLSLVTVSELLK